MFKFSYVLLSITIHDNCLLKSEIDPIKYCDNDKK